MNEELIEKRFNDIEEKIDKLTELLTQTQVQEFRLERVEKDLSDLQSRTLALEKSTGEKAVKIIGAIGGTIMTILLSFIAVKIGIKF